MDLDDITWSKNYLLTWDDFQGEVKDTPEIIKKSLKVNSNVGLDFEIHPKIIIEKTKKKFQIEKIIVKAVFKKNRSWVKTDQIAHGREGLLLKHEQGHFDLVEIYVKIAKDRLDKFVQNKISRIKEKKDEGLEKTSDNLSLKVTKNKIMQILDYKKSQDKYDSDTKHGIIQDTQKEYDKKFDQLRDN